MGIRTPNSSIPKQHKEEGEIISGVSGILMGSGWKSWRRLVGVASTNFDNLFQAGAEDQMEECLNAVQCKVTDDMRESLF